MVSIFRHCLKDGGMGLGLVGGFGCCGVGQPGGMIVVTGLGVGCVWSGGVECVWSACVCECV